MVGPGALKPKVGDGIKSRRPLSAPVLHSFILLFFFLFCVCCCTSIGVYIIIGERERANLVVQLARFFYIYIYVYIYVYPGAAHTVMFYVLLNMR